MNARRIAAGVSRMLTCCADVIAVRRHSRPVAGARSLIPYAQNAARTDLGDAE
jgi:hypothetical protein